MKNKEIKTINDLYPIEHLDKLSINELDILTEEIYSCIHYINEIRDKKETEQFNIENYINKYLIVKDKHRGKFYIQVQNQWHTIRNGEGELFLEGQALHSIFNPSKEHTYFYYEQWEQLEINIEDIYNDIEIISKEQFINEFNKLVNRMNEEFNEIVEHGNKNQLL